MMNRKLKIQQGRELIEARKEAAAEREALKAMTKRQRAQARKAALKGVARRKALKNLERLKRDAAIDENSPLSEQRMAAFRAAYRELHKSDPPPVKRKVTRRLRNEAEEAALQARVKVIRDRIANTDKSFNPNRR